MNLNRASPTLDAKIEFLRRPDSYPEAPAQVEFIETHMSCVFLTGRHAYKLKKPVRFEFLDFSTTELRRLNCEREVTLNRRLAPDVYLSVVPLTVDFNGTIAIDGPGQPIDWLVKMRQLSNARMLDSVIAAGALQDQEVQSLAGVLTKFYTAAPPVDIDPPVYWHRYMEGVQINRREMVIYGLPSRDVDRVSAAQLKFLEDERLLIESRARDRHIVEAHGDLRPEHVYLGPPVCIIDCLEFDRDLRLLDPLDELSFLGMECDRLGSSIVGERVLAAYAQAAADYSPPQLVHFYKCFRACLRAKLILWHLRDRDVRTPKKWPALAREYLALADRYAQPLTPCTLT